MIKALRAVLAVAALLLVCAAPTSASASTTGDVTYVVGDSITQGYRLDPARGYGVVTLDRVYGINHTLGRVVAHGGQCLVDYCNGPQAPLSQTFGPEVLNATPAPTVIVIEIGTNDLGRFSDAQIETALASLVTQANGRGVRTIVGTIPPRSPAQWQATWPTWGPQRDRINAWIRFTYYMADFDACLAGSDGWARPGTMTDDGLHPSNEGAVDMAYCVPLAGFTE